MPFATEIVRSLDNASRVHGLSVVATNVGASRSARDGLAEVHRFLPKAIVYATTYHRTIALDPEVRRSIRLLINCDEASGGFPPSCPTSTRRRA